MKSIFVTVGSTQFPSLIKSICNANFVRQALEEGYDTWIIQCGSSCLDISNLFPRVYGVNVEYFDYRENIQYCFLTCDLIISHCGSGSILDTLRGPLFEFQNHDHILILVPNRDLLNDHQMELVNCLVRRNIAISVDHSDLMSMFKRISENTTRSNIPSPDEKTLSSLFL